MGLYKLLLHSQYTTKSQCRFNALLNQTSIIEFHEAEVHFASSNPSFLFVAFHLYFKVFIYKGHCFHFELIYDQ